MPPKKSSTTTKNTVDNTAPKKPASKKTVPKKTAPKKQSSKNKENGHRVWFRDYFCIMFVTLSFVSHGIMTYLCAFLLFRLFWVVIEMIAKW